MQGDASGTAAYPAFASGAGGDFGGVGVGGGPYGGPARAGGASASSLPSSAGAAASAAAPWGGGGLLPGGGGGGGAGLGAPDAETEEDYAQEPPLIEELGVSFTHIRAKLTAVLLLHRPVPPDVMADSDMAGPLVFCLALGFFLLLQGKLFLGYIYGFGLMGCLALFLLLTLMADKQVALDLSRTFSVLGYALLPIVSLAAVNVLLSLQGALGAVLGVAAVLWATTAATRIFESAMQMSAQRWLIAYPVFLLYFCFAWVLARARSARARAQRVRASATHASETRHATRASETRRVRARREAKRTPPYTRLRVPSSPPRLITIF
jgi:hypothetical protein